MYVQARSDWLKRTNPLVEISSRILRLFLELFAPMRGSSMAARPRRKSP